MNLTSLTLRAASALLKKAGSKRCSVADLKADLKAGAPVNPDGTLNLVHYAAWIEKCLST
jgi:hypothetical protein